jgi:hypothetical protein
MRSTHQLVLPPLALAPLADAVGLGLAGFDEELLVVALAVAADERGVGLKGVVHGRVRRPQTVEEQLVKERQTARARGREHTRSIRSRRTASNERGIRTYTSSL